MIISFLSSSTTPIGSCSQAGSDFQIGSDLDPVWVSKYGRIRFRSEHEDLKSLLNRTFWLDPDPVLTRSGSTPLTNTTLDSTQD